MLLCGMGAAVLYACIVGFPYRILDWFAAVLFALTAFISLCEVTRHIVKINSDLAAQTERSKQRNEQTVKIFSDNSYINAVLSNYDAICRKNNIAFSCRIGIENRELPATELCLILNNALENAVEASLTLPEKDRKIKTQIAVKQNRFLLRVSNRFDGDIETDNGLPVTKKDGKKHGYGLSNIRAAAERRGGSMEYSDQNGYFVLDVEFEIE